MRTFRDARSRPRNHGPRRPRLVHDVVGTVLFLALLVGSLVALIALVRDQLVLGPPVAVAGCVLGRLASTAARKSTRRIPSWVQISSFAVVAFLVPFLDRAPPAVLILTLGLFQGYVAPILLKVLINTWTGKHGAHASPS